jgi:integration host factor subunit beta
MIRSQLVTKLAEAHPHLPLPVVEAAVDTILNEIIDHLAKGRRVEIRRFGNFTTKIRNAQMGRNPKTGEPLQMERKQLMKFTAGKHLLGRLNGSQHPD